MRFLCLSSRIKDQSRGAVETVSRDEQTRLIMNAKKVRAAALFTESLLMTATSLKARIRILDNTRETAVRALCEMNGRSYYRPDRKQIHRELAMMYEHFGR